MPISLILTPFDHFHFRPTSGLLSSQDLTYCLSHFPTSTPTFICIIIIVISKDRFYSHILGRTLSRSKCGLFHIVCVVTWPFFYYVATATATVWIDFNASMKLWNFFWKSGKESERVRTCQNQFLPLFCFVQISSNKMKAELLKLLTL